MTKLGTTLVLGCLLTIGGLCWSASALAQEPPPIQVIFDLHMDPMHNIPIHAREDVYQSWRDAADWVLDVCQPRGAKVTFLSVGEYMEYTLEDPASWTLIERLYNSGGSIGTHSHREARFGLHDWRDLPPNATMPQIVQLWHDHVGLVDQVITAALGVSDPHAIRAINNSRGSHVPQQDAARIDLMRQFGFTIHQQGPDEEFYAYFQHWAMNPYRPSGLHFLSHDPLGPVIDSPTGPVLGRNQLHFGIMQDMRLPALKTHFLLELLNWLDDVFVAQTGRVWCAGWGSHGSDHVPGQPTRAAVEPILDWLKHGFIDQTASGRQALQFSSSRRSRDLYLAWEATHPGAIPFDYPASETSWAMYPYLLPVARYLVGGQHDDALVVGPVRLHRVIAAPEIGGPYALYVAYPSGPLPAIVDLMPLVGPGNVLTVNPRTGLAPPMPADHVPVPLTGVLLVPPDKRLPLPNGDVNLDGYLDFGDINPFVAVLTGQDPDPRHHAAADINRDGRADFGDINPFVRLLTTPPAGRENCGDLALPFLRS